MAFVWAVNSANGYPFKGDKYSVTPSSSNWDPTLDTNGDGLFDLLDDPFSPYYPGDQWVDWVGMSVRPPPLTNFLLDISLRRQVSMDPQHCPRCRKSRIDPPGNL